MIRNLLICAASLAVTGLFFIDFCNLVYGCGCRSLWAGAATHCNIYTPNVKHCPWCSRDWTPAIAAVALPQLAISFWPAKWPWLARLAAALAAFPLFGGLAALVYGYITGYWR